MASLPQLLEEDIARIDSVAGDFLARSEASVVLLTAEGGFCFFRKGDEGQFQASALGALASGVFEGTQAIAGIISEPNFSSIYQQGEKYSLLVSKVDAHGNLFIVLFPAHLSLGAIKYYAASAIQSIGEQIQTARQRAPGQGLDLAMLNLSETTDIFQKKQP
ncbi:MAG: hypothetical protein HY674_10105 [Chloroflexi bacterium]|nr:hypothetical protein [Chloroflexota bacterium]